MADISALGTLAPAEPINLDVYKTLNSRPQGIPQAGEYEVRVPDTFPTSCFGKTQQNQLKVSFDASIASGERTGFPIRFVNLSAKVWTDKKNNQQSQIGEYLAAMGYEGNAPTDPQEIADLFESTAGRTARVYCDWEAQHRATGFELKGMKNFPKAADGTFQPFVVHPTEKDAQGQPLRLRANLVIRRWLVPADRIN